VRPALVAAAALFLVAAGGCASYQGSTLSSQLVSWNKATSFWSQIGTVMHDAGQVTTARRQGDQAGVRDLCMVLSNDTRGAYQLLPSPAPSLSAGLNQALQFEESGAGDCFKGASGDAALAAKADGERARAAVALGAGCELYQRLLGAPPATPCWPAGGAP
jgi:hypothetical protein